MPELSNWKMPVVVPGGQQLKGLRIVEGQLLDIQAVGRAGLH